MSKRWEEIAVYRWGKLGNVEACYVVLADGRAIYIGQTFLLRTRMAKHNRRPGYAKGEFHTPWGMFPNCRIKVLTPKRFGESLMVEARLIRRLKPEFNQKGKTWGRLA